MNILRITILRLDGPDMVTLNTDLPPPMPNVDDAPLAVRFEVARGSGPEYVATHFPEIPCELIAPDRGRSSFRR